MSNNLLLGRIGRNLKMKDGNSPNLKDLKKTFLGLRLTKIHGLRPTSTRAKVHDNTYGLEYVK